MATALSNPLVNQARYEANFDGSWERLDVGGTLSPGVIPPNGIQGFKRETAWDIKKGKGVKGGTLTLLQRPPAKGTVTFVLWLPEHFVQWVAFLTVLKYDPDKTPAQALAIRHPSLAMLQETAFVVDDISPIVHQGKGRYHVSVTFIEFAPPPPVSAVSTPTTAQTTTDPDLPGQIPDLAVTTEQVLMSSLLAQASAP